MKTEYRQFFLSPYKPIQSPAILDTLQDYIVVYKPAGMHSVALASSPMERESPEVSLKTDLVSWLRKEMPMQAKKFPESVQPQREDRVGRSCAELGMLSRLDRDTSGLVLFAQNSNAFDTAMLLQRSRKIYKYYHLHASKTGAFLPGAKPKRGDFSQNLNLDAKTSKMLQIESHFRAFGENAARVSCISSVCVKACSHIRLSKEQYSTYLELTEPARCGCHMSEDEMCYTSLIFKGFRHQIRAHMAWLGIPIVGDTNYGGKQAERLFLEASRIDIQVSEASSISLQLYGEDNVGC
jgi:23S rRNA pseudouridine1911/1915/1917 synthase